MTTARGRRVGPWLVAAGVVGVIAVVALSIALRTSMRCAGFPGGAPTAEELPPPAGDDVLRVATWNVRNFPLDEREPEPGLGFSRRTNICDLETALVGLDADVLGVAEIRDRRRWGTMLRRLPWDRRLAVRSTAAGGRSGQRVSLVWDSDRLTMEGRPLELSPVALGDPRLRPALAVRLRGAGIDLTVAQIHLKAGTEGLAIRRRQVRRLATWAEVRLRTVPESALIVMGDANTVGGAGWSPGSELAAFDRELADSGLERLPVDGGCTSYWEGPGPRDGIQVPSGLDHVWVAGLPAATGPARAWLHCRRHGCRPLTSRAGSEDATFWDLSDHCPVTVDIPLPLR